MTRLFAVLLSVSFALETSAQIIPQKRDQPAARRVVILKVDGLGADLLSRAMRETDPATGKSRLPWLSHIFRDNGAVFENFYTRGISLSATSWSMLDTGHHAIIRGNVEYDRYTGHVYDYLNFFPFYLGYARNKRVDMPGVEVLDRAGIPLLIDEFPYARVFQSFQLFQRGVRWPTLEHVLERRFSSKILLSMLESAGTPSLDEILGQETEKELDEALKQPETFYLDFYTGDVDHEGHATNQPAALFEILKRLDGLAGRIWTAIQRTPLASETLFVIVSDHGMNNVPGVFSEGFSLPDLLNSPQGGAHHVITNRHQLSDFKIMGLDPLVQRVVTPSNASFYLAGEADHYPTAWLDLDGNERASLHLRNSDLNKIHILLQQVAKPDLPKDVRRAAAGFLAEVIDRHRSAWMSTADELQQEMTALQKVIDERKKTVAAQPQQWTAEQRDAGEDKAARRLNDELLAWERERAEYSDYIAHLRGLLSLRPSADRPFQQKISAFVPQLSLGDNNSVYDLQNYVVGLSATGLVPAADGKLDEKQSFRHVNYFSLFAQQRARNNPQIALSSRPIDFTIMRLLATAGKQSYWVYGDEENQLIVCTDTAGRIAVYPARRLTEDGSGKISWDPQPWHAGLPLRLFEDPNLHLPSGSDRGSWLSSWHTEREWFDAIHLCLYSNGVIGITEQFSPVGDNIPGPSGIDPILLRYERRRRELVQPDLQLFAADHWNFNVRNFNPGGNHGSFLRISTHSVWMMEGAGVPVHLIQEPYDSLNFASTILHLVGRTPRMPDRVVPLQ